MLIHVYKCPGPYIKGNICFTLKSIDDEEIPKGWFKDLADAAEDAGTKSLAPQKKNPKKRNESKAQKALGIPYVSPEQPAKDENIEPSQPIAKLTDADKMDILEMKHQKVKVKEIADKFDVSVPTVYKVIKDLS